MNFTRSDLTADVLLEEFDVLREKAEARLAMGSGPPDDFVSILLHAGRAPLEI